ncbi:hypothetical protein GDO86_007845 [Hymenochirus boettgeri]|uniref:Nardilysin n=1 Tax=Hymenochirus boettgeri TaxID=247094 RepID=A0A8T2J0Q9_9PIPI|nr:hypothetical protein GDO86_007845 [Hymenochirus boettgeri]KAG8436910.1 hypothetical protein GDO86_007845 [Hymenochirus boettgeri]
MEDPAIVKSQNDPKKYRYIQLENGLEVLLISDMSGGECLSDNSDYEMEEDEPEQEQEEEEDDDDSSSTGFEGMSSSEEKLSAAALCVGVGTFSDPEELPGLAHFLEHMVFMGSEKYPDENGFDVFLKKYGGSVNASTDCEQTVFQFDIQRKHFKEGLDRWAQFFIAPLMIRDAIEREVEAVDSEFQIGRPKDPNRKQMIFASLAKAGYPMGKFSWGNAQTLKHDPKEKNIDVYSRLKEFYKIYYSAHFMTLAVQSKETLQTLETWVREIFSGGLPKPDFSNLTDPFDTPNFNSVYKIVPIKNEHTLEITWVIPPQRQYYRVKPLNYLSTLIGHEGKGGILSWLRKRYWAVALYGGSSPSGSDQNSACNVFTITVMLTDTGFEHYYEIIHVVFQYLKMLKTLGPQERIFHEIQQIDENTFRYQEQTDPIKNVEDICENMQLQFPPFSYIVISAVVNGPNPSEGNIFLASPNNEGKTNLTEKWFGTQYSKEATDFSIKPSDIPDTDYPQRILNTELGCLWYKKDNKFKIPKAFVRLHLISPEVKKSPESLVLLDLFVNIFAHTLAELAYEAIIAQLEYKIESGEHGIVIEVKGFNHKLPLLFELIIDTMAEFAASSDVFDMIYEQLKKSYFNKLIKTSTLAQEVRLQILQPARWSLMEKYKAIQDGVSLDHLLSFVQQFKAQLYVEGLVQGNFTSKESAEFLNYIIRKIKFMPLEYPVPVQFQVVELPSAHHLCKVKTLNKGDANSDVTVYYQSGTRNLHEYTMMELLVVHMEEPGFDFLRTKNTLGYTVYPSCRNTSGILGFSYTVETQATKYNTEYVDQKIEEFLTLYGEKLNNLVDGEFQIQATLIKQKEKEDSNLGEEVDRNWYEVLTQEYLFDRLLQQINALKTFKKSDIIAWFKEQRGNNKKVLSVHIVGYGEKEQESGTCEVVGGKKLSSEDNTCLNFLPATPLMENAFLITDIRGFNSQLKLFPYHKLNK